MLQARSARTIGDVMFSGSALETVKARRQRFWGRRGTHWYGAIGSESGASILDGSRSRGDPIEDLLRRLTSRGAPSPRRHSVGSNSRADCMTGESPED